MRATTLRRSLAAIVVAATLAPIADAHGRDPDPVAEHAQAASEPGPGDRAAGPGSRNGRWEDTVSRRREHRDRRPEEVKSERARARRSARAAGRVTVIADLRVPFAPEGFLTEAEVRDQRADIQAAERRVVGALRASRTRFEVTRSYDTVPSLALEVSDDGLAVLADHPDVDLVEESRPLRPNLDNSTVEVGAASGGGSTGAWDQGGSGKGPDGAGQTIVVVDTGIEVNHEFFAGKIKAQRCFTGSPAPDGCASNPAQRCSYNEELCLHGTSAAGIAAGRRAASQPNPKFGVARGADLVAIRADTKQPDGAVLYRPLDLAASLDFVSTNLGTLGKVASVNLSVGSNPQAKGCDAGSSLMRRAVDNLRSKGVAVIASSGNDGNKNGISYPACILGVISVGAYNAVDDKVLALSNSVKGLDLLAPGNQIQSAGKVEADGTSRYRPFFATSAAAPHVAGAWAILKQRYPNATVTEVLAALRTGGVMITDTSGVKTPAIRINRALDELAGIDCTEAESGYWQVGADGGVFAFGDAGFFGSLGATPLNAPVVGMASPPAADGYWLAASDGGVFTFGSARFYGSLGGVTLNQPVVDIATRPEADGYWMVAADGGIFNFGNAGFYGSLGGTTLNAPIVGMAATPTGRGYWLVGQDGGVFAFGDAAFYGRATVNSPDAIVGITAARAGKGYFVVTRQGQIVGFHEGGNDEYGEIPASGPLTGGTGVEGAPSSAGYWVTAQDYNVYNFGDALHCGSRAGQANNQPLRGLQTTHWTDSATAAPAVNATPVGGATPNSGQVSGWAYDPNLASAAVDVQVKIDSTPFNIGRTVDPRPDINEQHHITGTHGFSWSAPPQYFDGVSHRMQVYALDLAGGPAKLLSDTTFTVVNRLPAGSFLSQGPAVFGNVVDPDAPTAAVSLYALIDGAPHEMGTTYSNGAFSWNVPAGYEDGQPHRVEVWARDANATGSVSLGPARSFLVLDDEFAGSNGDPLNPSKWVSSSPSSSRQVDIWGGEAQLRAISATARADANMAPVRDGGLQLGFRFENHNPGTKLRVAMRADSPFTTGYVAELSSGDNKVTLYKVRNGLWEKLTEGTYWKTSSPEAFYFTVRTQANGSADLAVDIDGEWALRHNDATVPITAPGTAQISHHYSTGTARSAYLSDIHFEAFDPVPLPVPLATGTTQLSESWTAADGTAWPASQWTTNSSTSRTLDAQGNQGRMRVISSTARAEAITADVAHADLALTYRFENRTAGSVFKAHLRADNPFANGYVVEVRSGETKIKLSKVVGGSFTTLGEFQYPMNTTAQRLRFRVDGSTLRVKVWPAGTPEPGGWAVTAQDSTFTGPGDLHLHHSYSSGSARSVWVDDLTLNRLS